MAARQTLIGSNSAKVKSHNLSAILLALLRHDYISRVRLAELTGLSTTTITNQITELLEQGIVVEEGGGILKRQSGAGRPRTALRLEPEAKFAIGIHIGVGSVRVGVADLRARIIDHVSLAHPLDKPAEAVLNEIVEVTDQVIERSGVVRQKIIGIGVGASGLVNPITGINLLAPNLDWHDIPIQALLIERLGLPVCVDNNVRAMALGEALFGDGRKARVLAFVYGRIGVGAGIVVDGQLFRGSGAGAGEIGHTTLLSDGGQLCRCGNSGCLETLVSEPAIMALAQDLAKKEDNGVLAIHLTGVTQPTIEQVFEAARAGDLPTRQMLAERARYMGIALANLINILNPELILLGGIFTQGQDLFLPIIEETIRQRAFANLGERVKLQPSSFGQKAGMVGGAALALTSFFYQQESLEVTD